MALEKAEVELDTLKGGVENGSGYKVILRKPHRTTMCRRRPTKPSSASDARSGCQRFMNAIMRRGVFRRAGGEAKIMHNIPRDCRTASAQRQRYAEEEHQDTVPRVDDGSCIEMHAAIFGKASEFWCA